MLVKVFKLDTEQSAIASLSTGVHTLGRGAILQYDDKRVSRKHAVLEIEEGNVKLTSIHINPCFVKLANSKTVTILTNGSSTNLGHEDTFAFLPDSFWFRVNIDQDNSNVPDVEENSKRQLEVSGEDNFQKRFKVEGSASKFRETSLHDTGNTTTPTEDFEDSTLKIDRESASVSLSGETNLDNTGNTSSVLVADVTGDNLNNEVENKPSTSTTSHQTGDSSESGKNSNILETANTTQHDANSADPGTSRPKPPRERCWYGADCYRKNEIHRNEYTHPGDSDYESDPNDDRPSCSFGARCYRKNEQHRKMFKHPTKQPPHKLPSKAKRQRKKVVRLNAADSEELRFLSDSEEEEDPFLADGDSDEYVGDTNEESDEEETQDVDEDSENVMKTLLKEAKKFVNK